MRVAGTPPLSGIRQRWQCPASQNVIDVPTAGTNLSAVTHEERANWIRRGIILLLAIGVAAGVWFYPERKPPPAAAESAADAVHYDLEIFLYHQPGNADSEQMAASLAKVAEKYSKQVRLNVVDITAHPEKAAAEKVTRPPKTVMMVGEIRACKFQGVWTERQIQLKVDEILHGLERMGKDWRPDVKGMQNAPAGVPGAPGVPAPPGKPAAP
jgi:hypothetical protein